MNEILTINYESENPTVSAFDIWEVLDRCEDFTQFFIACSEMKVKFDRDELRVLANALRKYYAKYGCDCMAYLIDSIQAEMTMPCKGVASRRLSEKVMKKEILNNFNKIFPCFDNVETEKSVNGIGRIDIYAEKDKRPVIIELKINRKNPNQQLLAYGLAFKNPILIGITEKPIRQEQKIQGIEYYALSELKEEIDNWIV